VIAVNALKELPELSLSVFDEDPELCSAVSAQQYSGNHEISYKRTVVLYLTVSTGVDYFQNVMKERIGIFESCGLDQLRLMVCLEANIRWSIFFSPFLRPLMSICPSPLESSVFHSLVSRSSRSLSVSPSIFQSCLELLSVGAHGLSWYALD